jgi:hypothetical protein
LSNYSQKERGSIVGFSQGYHVVHEDVKALLTDLINLRFGIRLGDISGDELVPKFWNVTTGVREFVILDYVFSLFNDNIRILDTYKHTFSNGEFTPS